MASGFAPTCSCRLIPHLHGELTFLIEAGKQSLTFGGAVDVPAPRLLVELLDEQVAVLGETR